MLVIFIIVFVIVAIPGMCCKQDLGTEVLEF